MVIRTEVPASKEPFWLLRLEIVMLPKASNSAEFVKDVVGFEVKFPPALIIEPVEFVARKFVYCGVSCGNYAAGIGVLKG